MHKHSIIKKNEDFEIHISIKPIHTSLRNNALIDKIAP